MKARIIADRNSTPNQPFPLLRAALDRLAKENTPQAKAILKPFVYEDRPERTPGN